MKLVVDANVLMSALIATEGRTCELLFRENLELYAPAFLMEEVTEHKAEILSRSRLSEEDLSLFISLLRPRILFVGKEASARYLPKARRISPNPDDTEYLALALSLRCALWSNDKRLKRQGEVKVYTTTELLDLVQRNL